jgi:peptidyl-tRNA hydrolase
MNNCVTDMRLCGVVAGLVTSCIVDGPSPIQGGTRTVVVIGPGNSSDVADVTKDLLLF